MSSNPSTPATMETPNTLFNALSKRAGPIDHLQVLRGSPKEILLLTDEYMSPALHNSSDTHQRHLRSRLQYGIELCKGQHQRQWINKTRERHPFLLFASHLEMHTQPFLHGFRNQARKDAAEVQIYGETKNDFAKERFLEKEARGMAELGWKPLDLFEIRTAIMIEDEMIKQRMEEDSDRESMNRSTSSVETATTTVSSVFDNEEENDNEEDNDKEEDNDDDESDHIYSFDDGKPECRSDTDDNTSFCHKPCSQVDSDSGNDGDNENDNDSFGNDCWSIPPPASLLYESLREREAKILADLHAVRAQAKIDIEDEWGFKVLLQKDETREASRNGWEHSCYLKVELQ